MNPNADKAYATNKYEGMSPERIVLALFDGALLAMQRSADAIEREDQKVLGEQLSKAMAIIGELQASLDKERGGEISERLDALYSYVIRGLLDANVNKKVEKIWEQHKHISTVREGWAEMIEQVAKSKTTSSDPAPLSKGYV